MQASQNNAKPSPAKWAALREELIIRSGPSGLFGAPSWTLEDPAAHRFFRLGWLEFETLSRWHLANAELVAEAISTETTLHPTPEAVEKVFTFALHNNLLQAQGQEDIARLCEQKKKQKVSWFKTAMKSYLFFRIPLCKPDALLERTYPAVAWLFSRGFVYFLGAAALLSFYLISRQWSQFSDSMAALQTWEGWAMVGVAMLFSKIIHELGHGYAAKRMRLKVPAMGVALMCFSPVLWTDTTEAWRLTNRNQRLLIGISGVMAEIILATAASWAWLLLPPGTARTAAFILAGTTWVMTIAVNANPLMRYDAYYLLSDFWEAPSLQPRSFALGRWFLRRLLFGLKDPEPEFLPPLWKARFIIYAYVCWIYRFFLFLGIAVLVYHLFFKLLGIVLFLIEMVFFIGLPIFKEVQAWWARRQDIWKNKRGRITIAIFSLLFIAFIWPWSGAISSSGLLMAERQTGLYAPMPAIIVKETPSQRPLKAGEVMLELKSPELEEEAKTIKIEADILAAKLASMSLNPHARFDFSVDWQSYQGLLHDQALYSRRIKQLTLKAPFEGRVVDTPPWLTKGQWVTPGERLGTLISKNYLVAVYVKETDLSRLAKGNKGFFEPYGKWDIRLPLEIISIDTSATRELPYQELASIHGGPIGVSQRSDQRLIPETGIYKVLCRISGNQTPPNHSLTGTVILKGKPKSLLSTIWQNGLAIVVRESGI